jgi:hypothetical protein
MPKEADGDEHQYLVKIVGAGNAYSFGTEDFIEKK